MAYIIMKTMMDMYILLIVIRMLTLTDAYNFTCPSQPHWNIRAKVMCKPPRNYTCLFDVNVYRERCSKPRISAAGYKYVFRTMNRTTCSATRYQPFISETIGYSDCTFQKSLCNSLGQEVYGNSNTTFDRTCICNTEKGYTFVIHPDEQCYCNPSTEDCSCYLGLNPYNKTVGLKDIKCCDDIKLARNYSLGVLLDMTRIIKISKFDNYKYNLNYVPKNEYRIEAAQWILMLSLANLVVCIILLIYLRRVKIIQTPQRRGKKIPTNDKIEYNRLMQNSEKAKRYFVRVMIVGKESSGKTCLLRRLLKEDISDVTSTDGVDIVVRRCKININDGKWEIDKGLDDYKMNQIKRLTTTHAEDKKAQDMQNETQNIKISQSDGMSSDEEDKTTDTKDSLNEDIKEYSSLVIHKDTNESSSFEMTEDLTTDTKVSLVNNKEKEESSPLVMPQDLKSYVFPEFSVNTSSDRFALCEISDFAGQTELYATHQAFLTSCVVYLVVADMEDDICIHGLSQCFADVKHIEEYVDFLFDYIHNHQTSDERPGYGQFNPPVVLVFTGKDKYDTEADFKKREKELNDQVAQAFGFQSNYRHLHNQFFLSNTKYDEKEFERVQYAIYQSAQKMDNWGKDFPIKWILLEHLIAIKKNDGKNFINFTEMSNLAKHEDIKIQKEEDLLLFLRFQHNVGNLIFFEDIRDLIILRPQWLADGFRCLVSVDNSKLHHLEDWTLFKQQGKLSESLITELFKSTDESQLSGQKDNLNKVMEKLDILVKIENSHYIMPSMMPSAKFEDVCEKLNICTEKCNRTSWLCFKFEFLPPSFFNHLSAWFIKQYTPSKVDSDSTSVELYRGICVFEIDKSGFEKILVTMSTDTIALQVVSFSGRAALGTTCNDIYEKVNRLIGEIKERYKVTISFKLHFNCSDGYNFKDTIAYEILASKKEYYCNQHKQKHQSDKIYSSWLNDEVKGIPDRAKINTKHDDKNPKNEPSKEEPFIFVTLRQEFNIRQSKNESRTITRCIKTGITLVFTDCNNDQLIICNSDGSDIHHIPLSYAPWYITEIDSNTVAVSSVYSKTILIINISTRSVTSTFNTSGYCYGISYNENNLYVVIKLSTLHVMDLTGKVMRTIPLPSHHIHDITVDRDKLVCLSERSIYCCSLDGKLIWKFKKDKSKDLSCVSTDDGGNVYVADGTTNTVRVISDDGKHYTEILTRADKLDEPWGIHFDKKQNILQVCNRYDGNVFLFDVKKKLE